MSDGGSGEKTEQPSPKKIRDARQKGQIARSQEVVTSASLMSVIAYLWLTWNSTQQKLVELFQIVIDLSSGDFQTNVFNALDTVFRQSVSIVMPVLGVTIAVGIAANFAQTGALFAMENLMPKLERVNPSEGFKRIFSMKQLVELLKSILKIIFLSILLFIVLRDSIGPYAYSLDCGLSCESAITAVLLQKLFMYSVLAFLIVAVADFFYQKHSHTKSLMMTKDEVKREYKESEGDPHIKGKRKQLAQELIMSDSGGAVRKSTALVVNPTHLAVAFRYTEGETPLPLVVAKGRGRNAVYLRGQAEEAGVPVFRNVGLARALYAEVELEQYIPDQLFDAVAEVLAWVARNKQTLYQGRLEHGVIDMDVGDHKAEKKN